MKKGLLFVTMAVVFGLSFTACSNDDEPDYTPEVAGIYGGDLIISIETGTTGGGANQEPVFTPIDTLEDGIVITRTGHNKVSLKLEDFHTTLPTGATVEIDSIVVSNVIVNNASSFFSLVGLGQINLTDKGLGSGPVVVEGKVDLSRNCSLTLLIGLIQAGGGTPAPETLSIKVAFEGGMLYTDPQ